MSDRYPAKQYAMDWIEQNRQRLSDFDIEIWKYAEPAWREYKSARAYVDLLKADGWDVEEGSGEMPTAFVARWGDGGPVLGAYAEYDAVPGNSQEPIPERAPRAGLHPYTSGHTDPHSMLGVAGLTGALAAKAAMEKYNIKGQLVFFGEPAEKLCGSKPIHAAKGYYDNFDAFICYHPWPQNTVEWQSHFGAYYACVFTFECVDPEGWGDPTAVPPGATRLAGRVPGAVDALMLMYTNTKFTRDAMFAHAGNWTLNEVILHAGDATADNLAPRFAQIQYAWRTPDLNMQEHIWNVLADNARHAAAVSGCEVSVRWVSKTRVALPNQAMADLTWRNLAQIGPPEYDESAKAFGREIQKNLGLQAMDNPFPDDVTRLLPPQDYEEQVRAQLPSWQPFIGADDYVEYMWHAPTVRLLTARPRLRPPSAGYQYPAWTYLAMGGRPEIMDPGMFVGGQTIAATLLDLATQEDELAKAKAEFVERTGGGVGGSNWVGPLLPKDIVPPHDLKWPEYITTERGDEWVVPTPLTWGEKL